MTCQEMQNKLSLYLYGELDFAGEEEFERHVGECSVCKRALEREKAWHAAAHGEHADVSLELLSECRRDLKSALAGSRTEKLPLAFWARWSRHLGLSSSAWSMRIAAASFLLFAGFTGGRWLDRGGWGRDFFGGSEASLFDPSTSRIRDIQAKDDHRIRIVVDHVREEQVEGSADDSGIRALLLAAAKDPMDPGIRVNSVELLKDESGGDVRDALVYAVRHDPNAGVRLKALEGLRRFSQDPVARETVAFVLEHDENAGVRSQAIDVLAPAAGKIEVTPELAGTLQQVMQSDQSDDYVRMRCLELLREMKALPTVNANGDVY